MERRNQVQVLSEIVDDCQSTIFSPTGRISNSEYRRGRHRFEICPRYPFYRASLNN